MTALAESACPKGGSLRMVQFSKEISRRPCSRGPKARGAAARGVFPAHRVPQRRKFRAPRARDRHQSGRGGEEVGFLSFSPSPATPSPPPRSRPTAPAQSPLPYAGSALRRTTGGQRASVPEPGRRSVGCWAATARAAWPLLWAGCPSVAGPGARGPGGRRAGAEGLGRGAAGQRLGAKARGGQGDKGVGGGRGATFRSGLFPDRP